jgi:predicted  nucleic acid-binding Zn-ribbon protein
MADNTSKLDELKTKIEKLKNAYASTEESFKTFQERLAEFSDSSKKVPDDEGELTHLMDSIMQANDILEGLKTEIQKMLEEMKKLEGSGEGEGEGESAGAAQGGSRRRRPSRKYTNSKRVLRRKSRAARRR